MGADGLAFHLQPIGALGQVDGFSIGFDQPSAPTHRLGLHAIHQLRAKDAVWEAREVFHMGGGHQLATGDAAVLVAGD